MVLGIKKIWDSEYFSSARELSEPAEIVFLCAID